MHETLDSELPINRCAPSGCLGQRNLINNLFIICFYGRMVNRKRGAFFTRFSGESLRQAIGRLFIIRSAFWQRKKKIFGIFHQKLPIPIYRRLLVELPPESFSNSSRRVRTGRSAFRNLMQKHLIDSRIRESAGPVEITPKVARRFRHGMWSTHIVYVQCITFAAETHTIRKSNFLAFQ